MPLIPALRGRGYCCTPHALYQRGFTLIEMMVVVVIMAILASIAIPSFAQMFKNMEASRVQADVMNAFVLSKTRSYSYRKSLIFCLADVSYACHRSADNRTLIFLDRNNNRRFDSGVDEMVLDQPISLKHGTIRLRAGNRHFMHFSAETGTPKGFQGHIAYCPNDGDEQRRFKVSINDRGIIRYKPHSAETVNCG